ncbi:MAG: sulfatase-modifying factor protein [Flavobacteriaceae bacterium]|nr:sulfatase-modifying factor protein [Flavobacteriaceae bacterium]
MRPLKFLITGFLFLGFHLVFAQKESYRLELPGTTQALEMVFLEGGDFKIGSPSSEKGHQQDESPQAIIEVASFWMASTETTWNLYQHFVDRDVDGGAIQKKDQDLVDLDIDAISGATTPYVDMSFGMGTDDYPAIGMTQKAAVQFCKWLSALTGNFYRLPTEAEWEYACRAGSQTAYSHGNYATDLELYAWFEENSNGKYHKVGKKNPNAWGLYDMHGNIAEWTLDQYEIEAYNKLAKVKWNKPLKTYPKAVRGGSWIDSAEKLRSAARRGSHPQWKMRDPQIPKSEWWHTDAPFVGFRIVRPYQTPSKKEQELYWTTK